MLHCIFNSEMARESLEPGSVLARLAAAAVPRPPPKQPAEEKKGPAAEPKVEDKLAQDETVNKAYHETDKKE